MSKIKIDTMMDAVEWTEVEWTEVEGEADDVLMPVDTPYVTHQGILHVGPYEFRCYQLSDGRRVLDADDVHRFFGLFVSGYGLS